jgi:predicted molibdopterin-dependent oxidoreductase YjgC
VAAPRAAQLVRIGETDRRTVRCRVNGQLTPALAGDTLLTVLLTRASRIRSFEFGGGYRAGFCLMGACQDCWVEVNDLRVRACSTLVADGMDISTEVGIDA